MEDFQQERARLDAEWEKLRVAKQEFQTEMGDSPMEQKLFVGNLDDTTTEQEVTALFEPFGAIKEVYMLKDKEGKSKRSSFVKMFTVVSAERAIEGINGKIKDKGQEKMIVVRFAAARPPMPTHQSFPQQFNPMPAYGYAPPQAAGYGAPAFDQSYGAAPPNAYGRSSGPGAMGGAGGASVSRGPNGSNLYINNVALTASEEEVRAMFSDFGSVLSIKLFAGQGYGFVSYDNPQSASNAIHALNGLAIGNGQKRLEVSHKKDKPNSRFAPY